MGVGIDGKETSSQASNCTGAGPGAYSFGSLSLVAQSNQTRPALPYIQVSAGEVYDRLSITLLKLRNSKDHDTIVRLIDEAARLSNVNRDVISRLAAPDLERVHNTFRQLDEINAQLWDLEDKVRAMLNRKDYDKWGLDDYYDYARIAVDIPVLNDRRASAKRAIDRLVNPGLGEIKIYTDGAVTNVR